MLSAMGLTGVKIISSIQRFVRQFEYGRHPLISEAKFGDNPQVCDRYHPFDREN